MKISLVTMPPLLILPAWLLFKFRPVFYPNSLHPLSWKVCTASLPGEELPSRRGQEPAAASSHRFPTDLVMPETGQGFSTVKCNFPIPRMMGWTQTSLAVGRDKAGSSGRPDFFPLLTFARFLLRSPVCFALLE